MMLDYTGATEALEQMATEVILHGCGYQDSHARYSSKLVTGETRFE